MRISAIIAGATLAFGLAACSDSSPTVNSVDVSPAVGTYALTAVDGQKLPWTDTVHNMTLISAAFTIKADGTWEDAVAYLDGTTAKDSGTYTISGSSATIMLSGKPYQATIANGSFTLAFAGHMGTFSQF